MYPKNFIRSTNYNIEDFLHKNCQIVTINYQYQDKHFEAYQQLFPKGYGIVHRDLYDLVEGIEDGEDGEYA